MGICENRVPYAVVLVREGHGEDYHCNVYGLPPLLSPAPDRGSGEMLKKAFRSSDGNKECLPP